MPGSVGRRVPILEETSEAEPDEQPWETGEP